jgi:hypothetical protein
MSQKTLAKIIVGASVLYMTAFYIYDKATMPQPLQARARVIVCTQQ